MTDDLQNKTFAEITDLQSAAARTGDDELCELKWEYLPYLLKPTHQPKAKAKGRNNPPPKNQAT